MLDDSNPLDIQLFCSACGRGLKAHANTDCEGQPRAYLPVDLVPDGLLERKRAELLKMNAEDGPRELTEEERARAEGLPPAQYVEEWDEPEPETPATGEDIPEKLRAELGEGFG